MTGEREREDEPNTVTPTPPPAAFTPTPMPPWLARPDCSLVVTVRFSAARSVMSFAALSATF